MMLRALDSDPAVTSRIRDAAVHDLFVLIGAPPHEDRTLHTQAERLLEEHLARIACGEIDPDTALPAASCNVSCLGKLAELPKRDGVHAWGHFIAQPRAFGAAASVFTPADGVPRAYMATIWQASPEN